LKKKLNFKGKNIQKLKDLYDISIENDRLNFTLIENRHCSTTIETRHLKILLNVTIPNIFSITKKENLFHIINGKPSMLETFCALDSTFNTIKKIGQGSQIFSNIRVQFKTEKIKSPKNSNFKNHALNNLKFKDHNATCHYSPHFAIMNFEAKHKLCFKQFEQSSRLKDHNALCH